ncbi:hypothetical protein AAC387_Pa11g1935 [Persea americana]
MDGCSSSWDMAMGNQCPLHPLPFELLNSTKDPLQSHCLPSSSHVFYSSIGTHEIPPPPPPPPPPPSIRVSNSSFSIEHKGSNIGGGEEELCAMKEMMYKIAVMQPVDIDPATIQKPKRRNVRISDDPQSVAARHRREKISERIRILQRLVPGGMKMDTASMLDEAIRYVKFLKRQVKELQTGQQSPHGGPPATGNWQIGPIDMGSSSSLGPPGGARFDLPEMANATNFSDQ